MLVGCCVVWGGCRGVRGGCVGVCGGFGGCVTGVGGVWRVCCVCGEVVRGCVGRVWGV